MKLQEQLFCALTDVGDDLVEEAGRLSFPVSPLRRMLPLAACCALLLGAALALESWKPIQEADITLPGVEDTVQEVVPPVEEDVEERPSSAPSIYILHLDDSLYGARQAVDQNGNVLAEVARGDLYLLKDQSTGEALAICARDNLEENGTSVSPIDLYDLQGNYLTTVEALYISCTGNIIQIYFGAEYRYYSRTDFTLIASGYEDSDLRNDFLLASDLQSGISSLFDTSGNIVATFPTERYGGRIFEWDEKHYFAIADEAGRVGLMDTAGAWVLEPAWDAITTVALGQAVVSLNGTYQVVSLDSGEVLFTWPYTICEIHAEGYVVETEDGRQQALELAGQPVSDPAYRIELIDDEGDGQVELIEEVQIDDQLAVYRRTDGTLVQEVSFQFGELHQLSSRTATFRKENGNLEWLIDVETGEKTTLPHEYFLLEVIDDYDDSILCYGSYRDESDVLHTDILNEFGEVILPDVFSVVGVNHLGDGVFAANRDGKRVLMRVDGTILYESDAPA